MSDTSVVHNSDIEKGSTTSSAPGVKPDDSESVPVAGSSIVPAENVNGSPAVLQNTGTSARTNPDVTASATDLPILSKPTDGGDAMNLSGSSHENASQEMGSIASTTATTTATTCATTSGLEGPLMESMGTGLSPGILTLIAFALLSLI